MKILIVGGTGLIGGHTALALRQRGHEVALAARKPVSSDSPLGAFPTVVGDYTQRTFTREALSAFDALVFSAANDPRHLLGKPDEDAHWRRVNTDSVPYFFELARDAGIKRAVNVGSFYPQAVSWLIDKNAYVRSRHEVDVSVRALNSSRFQVCCVNPSSIVGVAPGDPNSRTFNYIRYALGLLSAPVFAIPGGVNFMSVRSLAEAIVGALEVGEPGKAYLVGDENLTYQEYLGTYFRAVGRSDWPEVRDQANPVMVPNFGGPGAKLFFETDPADVAELRYRRSDIRRTVEEGLESYRALYG